MLELASILVLGIFAQWLAWKIKQPAILPLILIGLLIGPFSVYFTTDGAKLIDGDQIFTGDLLFSFVSISVGVILFEGGMTLNLKEIRSLASTVRNLLITGSLITFLGGGMAAHFIMGLSWKMSFLFGALIIVSGPTVIMPILRNVKPNSNINTVLKWEGILIDPLGALVAVLMYEFILSSAHDAEYGLEVFQDFFITISAGIVSGGLGALFLYYLIKNNALPEYLRNTFTLGLVIFTFAFSELIHKEAGLMAATMMGIVLGNLKLEELKKILSFKEDISQLLISVLFILLSSRIDFSQIEKLGSASLILFVIVAFGIRPLGVILSSYGSNLTWKEKAFISWIGPKGIVAAAVASLFSLDLIKDSVHVDTQEAELLLPLVFLIIVGTVVLQGSTAKFVAQILGVKRDEPTGIVIVGANELARKFALKLNEYGVYTMLADTSSSNIKEARKFGLKTTQANILSDQIFEALDMSKIGYLAALTSNSGLNDLAATWFEKELGPDRTYRLVSKEETENPNLSLPKEALFNARVDFITLAQLMRKKDPFGEFEFDSGSAYEEFMTHAPRKVIPLFLVKPDNKIELLSGYSSKHEHGKLVFLKTENFDDDFEKEKSTTKKDQKPDENYY